MERFFLDLPRVVKKDVPCKHFFSLIISQIIREYGTQGPTLGFWGGECRFIALGVDAIQGNVCKIQGQ